MVGRLIIKIKRVFRVSPAWGQNSLAKLVIAVAGHEKSTTISQKENMKENQNPIYDQNIIN